MHAVQAADPCLSTSRRACRKAPDPSLSPWAAPPAFAWRNVIQNESSTLLLVIIGLHLNQKLFSVNQVIEQFHLRLHGKILLIWIEVASRHYRTSFQRRAAGDAHVLQQLHYLCNPLRCDSEMRDWRAEGGGGSTWTLRAGKSKGSKSSISLMFFSERMYIHFEAQNKEDASLPVLAPPR